MTIVEEAQRIADEVLFPAALATDSADAVPRELLDALAASGLYGLSAPRAAGGLEADFPTVCRVQEALASGCLTTAFILAQHLGVVRSLARSGGSQALRWLPSLATGEVRAGLGLGGALPRPTLRAREESGQWIVDGASPFVSGWGLVDVLQIAARTPDDQVVWLIVDACESPALRVDRLRLVALNATATVRVTFSNLLVAADRVTGKHPVSGETAPEVLRMHAALALGVAARCCRLLGPSALDHELAAVRTELDKLGPGVEAARAAAGELAVRAAAAMMVSEGSRSLLATDQAQRLMREAMFALTYALRPGSRSALLETLESPRSPRA